VIHNLQVLGDHYLTVRCFQALVVQSAFKQAGRVMMGLFERGSRSPLRPMLTGGVSLLALGVLAGPVMAQDPVSASAQQSSAEEMEADSAIVVTGSRLRTDGTKPPTPITVVDATELEAMGPSGLIEGVSQLPQFFGNQSVAALQKSGEGGTGWFTRGGYGNLDLRGLGINRTLTLLNGHRVVSSSAFGGVDINVFPDAMIRSVETVTGGASAAYGSDAVAGVVNFILDKKFTGLRAEIQNGITSRGDNHSYQGAISYGVKLGGRGHFLVSGEYSKQEGIHNFRGRDWYKSYGSVNGGIYSDVVSANSSLNGIILAPGTALQGMEFLRNGQGITPFVRSAISQGATGTALARQSITAGGSGDRVNEDLYTIYPDAERNSIYAYADYEIADNVTIFAQYMRGQNKTFRYNLPGGSLNGTPTTATIFSGNAFLPASLQQTMTANNIASFTLRRLGSVDDLALNSWQSDNSVMNSFAGGLTWDIDRTGLLNGWQVDLYYQYGTNNRKAYQNGLRVDRLFAALDAVTDPATGNTVCRTSLFGNAFPGCVPLNLFGRGNASAAAIDYVTGYEPGQTITTPVYYADTGFARGDTMTYTSGTTKVNITDLRQHVAEFSMNGQLFEGWAGPISLAFGGSYRKESIKQLVQDPSNPSSDHVAGHPVLCSGQAPGLRGVSPADCANTVGLQFSKVSNIIGSIAVKEAFAETLVPLLADAGPIRSANLHLAGRWANYSGSGTVWAYKAGLEAEISNFLRLRGTYSRDVRAANLSERFDKTGGTAVLDDPRTTNVVEAINVTRFSGGNPNVKPEKADTWTVGAVFQPGLIPGFSVSADYYDIRIKGAIGQLGPQAVLNGCLINNDADLCSLVTLGANGAPILVGDVFINVNENRVRGFDVEASYNRGLKLLGGGAETIGARVFASWLFESSQTLGSGVQVDRAGQTGIQQSDGAPYGLPKFKLTGNLTYGNGGFSTFLQGRYIGSGMQENTLGDVPLNHVDSAFYLDLRLSQKVSFGSNGSFEIFGAITNLTDKSPPITAYYSSFAASPQQFNSVLFDLIGRRFTVGVKFGL
jgi:iron complex outermembrane receptor protein